MSRIAYPASSLALAGLALFAVQARAQQPAAPKPLVMTAQNLMVDDERHRAVLANHGDPETAMAGDVIRYRLTFTNTRPDSVRNVQFTDPLPAGLHYVGGSAHADRADVAVEFSIDGGRTWAEQPMVDVVVDGRPVRQAAPASMYTNVRWSVRGWVPSRGQVTAEFNTTWNDGVTKP